MTPRLRRSSLPRLLTDLPSGRPISAGELLTQVSKSTFYIPFAMTAEKTVRMQDDLLTQHQRHSRTLSELSTEAETYLVRPATSAEDKERFATLLDRITLAERLLSISQKNLESVKAIVIASEKAWSVLAYGLDGELEWCVQHSPPRFAFNDIREQATNSGYQSE